MHRGTVLIVDDDPNVTATFARMLRLEGYDVVTALDAEDGWRELETAHPDVVLLDLVMPRVNGLALLRRLRAQEGEHRTPVAIVTGNYCLEEAISRELTELGASLHFKPLWFEDVVGIAQGLLGRCPRR
jgi:DNA-binding response OmpR family regulator